MVPMASETLDNPVSLELVLAQLKIKEQYCKDLQDSQKSSQQQILELLRDGGGNRSLARDERLSEHGNKKPLTEFEVLALLKNVHKVER